MIHVDRRAARTLPRDRRVNAAAPVVAYGDDAIWRLPGHVAESGAQRVLLVCGRRSFEASGAAQVMPDLERVVSVRRWSDFVPNTDSADLRGGLQIVRDYEPDLMLGVGGGSALDMAKLLATFGAVPTDGVFDAIRDGYRADTRKQRLFLVPTTSGSGAEATHFAVVYIGDDKYSIGGRGMRPDAIVLDPKLSVTGSRYQRATSGIDAVSQAIESLWATAANDRSRHFARVALRLLIPAIRRFVNDPDESAARAMSIGSHFAGRAIDISRTTVAHALSYGITKSYGVSHGHAVAMTLGVFLEAHADARADRLRPGVDPTSHAAAMDEIQWALGANGGEEARRRLTEILDSIGLDPSLSVVGARDEASRKRLASTVNAERLGNNPVAFSALDLEQIILDLD